MTKYAVELEQYGLRLSCSLCGNLSDKGTTGRFDGDGVICEQCLAAGSENVRDRILEHAERLEQAVALLRHAAATDSWALPDAAAIRAFEEDADRRYRSVPLAIVR